MFKQLSRIAPAGLIGLLVVGGVPASENCEGREVPWIGAEVMKCSGGSCTFSRWQASSPSGFSSQGAAYDFSTEPRLLAIRSDGPAAGRLEEHDVLVAVNGFMITSPRGGRELAHLPLDRPAALMVRRDDRIVEVEVRPTARCAPPAIIVPKETSATPASGETDVSIPSAEEAETPSSGPGSLGVSLECNGCRLLREDSDEGTLSITLRVRELFSNSQSLVVTGIREGGAAWRAGLLPGDTLLRIDGFEVNRDEALDALIDPRAGRLMEIDYLRDGRPETTTLVADPAAAVTRPTPGSVGSYSVSGTSWGIGTMGLTLEFCEGCSWSVDSDGDLIWRMKRPLEVVRVDRQSPADRAGLRPGDIVTHVDFEPITDKKAGTALLNARAGDRLELRFQRNGRESTTTLELPRK